MSRKNIAAAQLDIFAAIHDVTYGEQLDIVDAAGTETVGPSTLTVSGYDDHTVALIAELTAHIDGQMARENVAENIRTYRRCGYGDEMIRAACS